MNPKAYSKRNKRQRKKSIRKKKDYDEAKVDSKRIRIEKSKEEKTNHSSEIPICDLVSAECVEN